MFRWSPKPTFLTLIFIIHVFSESENGIFNAILSGQIDFASDPWPAISHQAKDLVRKMLNSDPKQRLTAAQVLSKHLLSTIYCSRLFSFNIFCFPYV